MCLFCVFLCFVCIFSCFFELSLVSTSASDCSVKLVSKMTYCVSTHSLIVRYSLGDYLIRGKICEDKTHWWCRFLQLAEMMKPSTPGTGAQSGLNGFVSSSDDTLDYFPHIGMVSVCAYIIQLVWSQASFVFTTCYSTRYQLYVRFSYKKCVLKSIIVKCNFLSWTLEWASPQLILNCLARSLYNNIHMCMLVTVSCP